MKKNISKLTAATFAIMGAGIILFNSATEIALIANNGKVEKVPTSYQISNSLQTVLPKAETKEKGSEKVNYFVSMDSLNTGTPTNTDLTMEEAAEVGSKYLENIFGLDLTPESTRWNYMIDAVTGELFNIGHDEPLDVSVSLDYDTTLEKDYHLYAELAQKKIEECKLMDSLVDRVEYNCQGYSGNNPTITVDVIGENGEIVNMSFSRYDQMFLGLITDTSRRITESALNSIVGEVMSENWTVIVDEFKN